MHRGPGPRAARPPDPRRASRLRLPLLSRPRKTNPRLLGPVKSTLATEREAGAKAADLAPHVGAARFR